MGGSSLAERMVGPEAHDGQPEWVDGQLIVLHVLAEDIGNAGRPSLPLEFGVIRRVGVHLLELDAGRIGRLTQVVKDDVLDLYIDIRKGAVFDVSLNEVVPAFLVDYGALHVAIQEVKRVGLVALNGETVAAKIQFRPARKVVFVFGLLRSGLEVAIVDGFGWSHARD